MSAREGGQPFDPRLIAGIAAAGILAFIGFFVLSAYAGNFSSGRDGRAHALSVSAVGYKGMVDLIGLTGGDTTLVRQDALLDDEALLIATLEENTSAKRLQALLDRRAGKATLLVLPKWMVQPHPFRPSWVAKVGPAPPFATQALLPKSLKLAVAHKPTEPAPLVGQSFLEGFDILPAGDEIWQTVSGPGLEPLLTGSGGSAVLARVVDRGPLYILADPDLINNRGLRDPRRARAALKLIDQLNSTDAESVMFDLTLSGFGETQSMLRLAFEPPFVALTVCLLAAGLLAGLHGIAHFGPRSHEARAIALGKAALVDNSAGLVRLARREHRVGAHYADLVRAQAAHNAGAPVQLSGAELDSYLDRVGPAAGPRFSELASAVRASGDPDNLLGAARALFRWKKDMTR
ncbi:MAG TPA: DUF4350 domain-containing protein [Allosphingosinicella sp.]|jgi:hypothetical protein